MAATSIFEHTAVRWLLAGGVAAGLAGIVIGESLQRPAHEVRYSGRLSMAHCAPTPGPLSCTFKYRFSVGNTGNQGQASVRIEWPADPPRAMVDTKISDIVASARKTSQPRVQQQSEMGNTVFVISELEPNTVVDIDLFCALCERADLDAFRGIRAKVEARGRVTEADPRVSTFENSVINFLRVLGFFR